MIVYERYIYRKLKRRRLVKKSNKLNGRWNKIKREGENEVETKKKERKKIRSSSIQNETSDPSLSRVHPSQNSPLYQIKHRSKNYQNTLDEDKEGKQEGEYKYRIKKKTRGRVVTTGGLSRLSRMIRAGSPSPPTSKEWSRKAGWRGLCSSSRRDPLPRDASFACFLFPLSDISLIQPLLFPPPWLLSDVFHQINSRGTRYSFSTVFA